MSFVVENNMRPIHPGEHIREDFLIPLNMSVAALATALQMPAPHIDDIVHEKCGITPDVALRLAQYFKTTPEYWLRWQMNYDLRSAR